MLTYLIKNVDDFLKDSLFLNLLTIFVYFKELVEDSMESDVDIDNDITNPGKMEDSFTCTFAKEDLDLPAGVKVLY